MYVMSKLLTLIMVVRLREDVNVMMDVCCSDN